MRYRGYYLHCVCVCERILHLCACVWHPTQHGANLLLLKASFAESFSPKPVGVYSHGLDNTPIVSESWPFVFCSKCSEVCVLCLPPNGQIQYCSKLIFFSRPIHILVYIHIVSPGLPCHLKYKTEANSVSIRQLCKTTSVASQVHHNKTNKYRGYHMCTTCIYTVCILVAAFT